MKGSERTEQPTDSRRSKEERRKKRSQRATADRNQIQRKLAAGTGSLQQIIHRTPDQAAGEPPEQATRLQVQQIRLTSQLRTL